MTVQSGCEAGMAQMIFASPPGPVILPAMTTAAKATDNWTDDLVRFLCEQPGVGAVRLDPAAHRLSVATLGQVDVADLEARLAATIGPIVL